MTTGSRVKTIATQIAALPDDHVTQDVWALFRPDEVDAFIFMDEKPGSDLFYDLRDGTSAHGKWHRFLRMARNDTATEWPFK